MSKNSSNSNRRTNKQTRSLDNNNNIEKEIPPNTRTNCLLHLGRNSIITKRHFSFLLPFFAQVAIIDYDYVRFLCYAISFHKFDSIQSTCSFSLSISSVQSAPLLDFLVTHLLWIKSAHFFSLSVSFAVAACVCVCLVLEFVRSLSRFFYCYIFYDYIWCTSTSFSHRWFSHEMNLYDVFHIAGSCFNA